jgi:enoyl-CoA hydratase
VVAPGELLAQAVALAHDIASAEPEFVTAYKQLIEDGYALPFGEGLALEHRISSEANSKVTPDAVEQRRGQVMARGRTQ